MSDSNIISSRMEIADGEKSEDDRPAEMRKLFERAMARKPRAMILMADYPVADGEEGRAGTGAVGSELDIRVLHQAGTQALMAMLRQAHEEVGAQRPEKLDG